MTSPAAALQTEWLRIGRLAATSEAGEALTAADYRAPISQFLTGLLQAEHLALLVGSGLTLAASSALGVAGVSMDAQSFDAELGDKVSAEAERAAVASGRGSPNIEDLLNDLQAKFFADLDMLFYAAAALPQNLWERLEAMGRNITGRTVPFISSYGLTETAPAVTMVHFPIERSGNIGVPGPGMAVRLVPDQDKLEIRIKGPNVTPGYFKAPEHTAKAFDEDGWFRTGDAVRLADPQDPNAGLLFDGRTAENFKLSSGTWVNVGMLRPAVIAPWTVEWRRGSVASPASHSFEAMPCPSCLRSSGDAPGGV